jgi:uncharacterized protein (DUF1501 family)
MQRRKLLQLAGTATLLPLLPFSISRASGYNGRRVILLELAGANDGLNTLVPYSDDRYYALRPTIGLKQSQLLKLNDNFGVHSALQKAMPLWESGELAAIHGLGYPLPNRSHFKSIALWETGGDGSRAMRSGWATHDVEHAYASKELDAHGIALGGGMGVFSNAEGNWLSMSTADQYANLTTPEITDTAANNSAMATLLDNARVLQSSLDRLSNKIGSLRKRVNIPGGALSQQMTHAVNIINAGVDVPVIKISLGSFDTHENQLTRHKGLLTQAATAIIGLREELIKSGEWQNTLLITYSEFGRRAAENRSGGTDHGTAAAHFIAGGSINGGLYGEHPDLGLLEQGDLQHTMDYRAMYSSVLSNWLALPSDRFSDYSDTRLNGLFT